MLWSWDHTLRTSFLDDVGSWPSSHVFLRKTTMPSLTSHSDVQTTRFYTRPRGLPNTSAHATVLGAAVRGLLLQPSVIEQAER